MLTTIIVILTLLGLILIVLELFVIPGITIAGVAGFIFTAAGIYLTYKNFGTDMGHLSLALTLLFFVVMMVFALRSKTWNRFMLTTNVDSTVEAISQQEINEGDLGKTITRLNPVGKVKVNGLTIEARCPGEYVEPGTEVIISKVYKNHVIVKLKPL